MATRTEVIRSAKKVLKSRGYPKAIVRVNRLDTINVSALHENDIAGVAQSLADDTMYFAGHLPEKGN